VPGPTSITVPARPALHNRSAVFVVQSVHSRKQKLAALYMPVAVQAVQLLP
jgi:hypothetical protein